VIALAVSTGMNHRWMQKIVYKMMDIPQKDKFINTDPKDTAALEGIYNSIISILHEYGIVHKSSC
jgi:hypothetical protein